MTAPIFPRRLMPPSRKQTPYGVIVEFSSSRRDPLQRAPEFCKGHTLVELIAQTAAKTYVDPVDAAAVLGRAWFSQGKRFDAKPTRAQFEAEEPEVDEWNTPIKYV